MNAVRRIVGAGAGAGPQSVLLHRKTSAVSVPPPTATAGGVIVYHPATLPTLVAGLSHLFALAVSELDETQEARVFRLMAKDPQPAELWPTLEALAFDPDCSLPARGFAILALSARSLDERVHTQAVIRRLLAHPGTAHLEATLRLMERTGTAGFDRELAELRVRADLPVWAADLIDEMMVE